MPRSPGCCTPSATTVPTCTSCTPSTAQLPDQMRQPAGARLPAQPAGQIGNRAAGQTPARRLRRPVRHRRRLGLRRARARRPLRPGTEPTSPTSAPTTGGATTPGIWELTTDRAYTSSKMNCWRALDAAARLAEAGQLDRQRPRWQRRGRADPPLGATSTAGPNQSRPTPSTPAPKTSTPPCCSAPSSASTARQRMSIHHRRHHRRTRRRAAAVPLHRRPPGRADLRRVRLLARPRPGLRRPPGRSAAADPASSTSSCPARSG